MTIKITAVILLAVVLLCILSVGFTGTNDGRIIDFEEYFTNVAEHADNFVDLRMLIVDIWTKEQIRFPALFYDLNMDGRIGSIDYYSPAKTYTVGVYNGSNEILEFFDGINEFFQRIALTCYLIICGLMSCWDFVGCILPWNYLTELRYDYQWDLSFS